MESPATLLASDLDGTLIPPTREDGSSEALAEFVRAVEASRLRLVYVTGRHLRLAVAGIEAWGLPLPDALACDVGTSVYWRGDGGFTPDAAYRESIRATEGVLEARDVRAALHGVDGLRLQEDERQAEFKVSYTLDDPASETLLDEIRARLHGRGRVRLVPSRDVESGEGLLDVLPAGIGKRTAVEHAARRLGVAPERVVYAGDSGNDRDALLAVRSSVVVGNADAGFVRDLRKAAAARDDGGAIFFADAPFSRGVLQGLRHFGVVERSVRSAQS